MIRRITGLLLAMVLGFSLMGCSGDDGAESAETNGTVAQGESATLSSTQVLLDSEGVVVTLKEITQEGTWGPALVMDIANGTDKQILLTSAGVSVNGLMVEPLWSQLVEPNDTVTSQMGYLDRGCEIMGVEIPQKIEMELIVNDPNTYEDLISSGTVTIETAANNTFQQTFNSQGQEVFNDSDIRIVSIKPDLTDDVDTVRAYFYMENNKDIPLMVKTGDVKLNGQEMEAVFEHTIEPGKKLCKPVRFKTKDLEAAGITDLKDLEVVFGFLNNDTWVDVLETPVIEVHNE